MKVANIESVSLSCTRMYLYILLQKLSNFLNVNAELNPNPEPNVDDGTNINPKTLP